MPALDSRRLLVLGRLHGLTRPRLRDIVQRAGGRVVERLGPGLDLVAVAHESVGPLFLDPRLMDLLERVPDDVALVSEFALKRRLGLMAPSRPTARSFTAAALARLSGLDEELLFWLALFDVVEPVDELYGYRDLVAARSIARLLDAGADFADVLKAGVALHRYGLGLSEVRLVTEGAAVLRELDGCRTEIDGQCRLPLDEPRESADELFESAEHGAAAGDFQEAERGYRRALHLDPMDPVIPFRLGEVLHLQGRTLEAVMAWRMALARDPGFADAWVHLGVAAETNRRFDEAAACFGLALDIEPGHADAAYALALLLYLRGCFAEALPAWDRFLRLEPVGPRADLARRYAILCRLQSRRFEAPAETVRPERP